jgi:hypothetical protein
LQVWALPYVSRGRILTEKHWIPVTLFLIEITKKALKGSKRVVSKTEAFFDVPFSSKLLK